MASYHVRSKSFPSNQHPLVPEFDEQLRRLASSQEASSSLVSSKFNDLQDLHDFVDRLLLLPLNQQALSKEENEKLVNELLDGSLRVLDLCDTAKNTLIQMKESTQEILSIIRRRRSGDILGEVKKFLASRKLAKIAINKVQRNVSSPIKENIEIIGMLREFDSIIRVVFESLFSFIASPKSSQKSLISKFMSSKRVVSKEVNEFDNVSALLNSLVVSKTRSNIDANAQRDLQKLEICIQDLEERVDSLYRRLIKTRVTLLNILNH